MYIYVFHVWWRTRDLNVSWNRCAFPSWEHQEMWIRKHFNLRMKRATISYCSTRRKPIANRSTQFYSAVALIESLLLCPSKDKLNLMNHLKKCILIPEFSKQIKIALSYSSIEYCARSVVIGCSAGWQLDAGVVDNISACAYR